MVPPGDPRGAGTHQAAVRSTRPRPCTGA